MGRPSQLDVLVTGAETAPGLAVIQSLGRRGVRVLAAGMERHSIGFYSRYAAATCLYPEASSHKEEFIEIILNAVRRYSVKLIFPVAQTTLVALDQRRAEVERLAKLGAPSSKAIKSCLDKVLMVEMALKLGIPVPKTACPQSVEDALEAAERIGYPVIMKPRIPWYYIGVPQETSFKLRVATTPEQVKKHLSPVAEMGTFPLVQEYCPGLHVGLHLAAKRDDVLAVCQYHELRRHLQVYGHPAMQEIVPVDSVLETQMVALLKEMDYVGGMNIQYQLDRRDGVARLVDINPRLSVRIGQAVMAGMDIPYIVYELFARSREIRANSCKVGLKCRWLAWDLESLIHYLRSDEDTSYDPQVPGKGKAILLFLRDFRLSMRYDVLSLSDPVPGIMDLLLLFLHFSGRIARRLARVLRPKLQPVDQKG